MASFSKQLCSASSLQVNFTENSLRLDGNCKGFIKDTERTTMKNKKIMAFLSILGKQHRRPTAVRLSRTDTKNSPRQEHNMYFFG